MNGDFPPPARVNAEQLEAECDAGFQVSLNLDVSLTTMAHVVMACQYALRAPSLSAPAAVIIRQFAIDATEKAAFPPELTKLIQAGWL